jgi:hypothetical protein
MELLLSLYFQKQSMIGQKSQKPGVVVLLRKTKEVVGIVSPSWKILRQTGLEILCEANQQQQGESPGQ